MQLHKGAHQRQPDAETSLGLFERAVCLGEEVEGLREHLLGHADAGVA